MTDEEDEILEPFKPRAKYSEVDPDFVEFLEMNDEEEEGDEEDLLDEEAEPPEEDAETVPFWATYELQGRNLDEGSGWKPLATEPFDGELTVDVEGLTAGASWEFRIRLVDRNGQRSRWSDPLQMSLPTDFTPPPAPTAPDVDENMGYITAWWDGSLAGPTPEDMSHVALHVQQMHPPDDPDGEPGDPYQVGTLSEAGSLPVGFLLVGVLYRAYLTAVDTSGNASPWSDMAEFTPTEAFGTEELEAELEELNTKTLPDLEQSLTTKADEATQAVQDFRDEWDENWDPEAIDELRGRADATEAEVATAKAEAEQAKQDAATAQANAEALEGRADATDAEVAAAKAEAEQAKQDAEAAQAKADAVEARADGLESALAEKAEASELNELDGILRGSVDLSDQVADKFYGNMAVVSRLQAEEGWIGGVALGDETVTARHVNMQDFTASQGFIDNAFVNLIQGKMANFDQGLIGGVLLKDGAVDLRHLTSNRVIIDGLLQASTGQLQELFFDEAVGNAISLGVADIIEINADRIRSNSWTGQTLTGAMIQTHSGDQGVKIHSNGTVVSRDNFSGDVIFRIGGIAGNFFSGTLRTQTSEGRGAEITEGNVTWQSMLEDGTVTRNSPYIRLHQDANTDESSHATIALLNAGNMLIAPGGQGTKMLQVDGVLSAPEVSARDNMSVVSSGGNIAALSVGQLSLDGGATRLTTSSLVTDDFAIGGGVGLMMDTSSSNQPAGLVIDGPRSYLVGRLPSGVAGNMMFAWEEWGGFDISSSSRRQSGTMTYGAPVPAGNRYPNLSASGNSGAWGAWRYFGVTGYNFRSSSFGWVVYRGDGSGAGNNRFYVEMIAPWN